MRAFHPPQIGTATGFIGDPSGKSSERQFLDEAQLQENALGIRRSVERVLTHWAEEPDVPSPLVLENAPFYKSLSALEFLRDVGRHFRVSSMLGRESVRARLHSGAGLSYTEFSYQVLQAWDFWRLFRDENCVLQLGGSDQWGNITAGVDLIRRQEGQVRERRYEWSRGERAGTHRVGRRCVCCGRKHSD